MSRSVGYVIKISPSVHCNTRIERSLTTSKWASGSLNAAIVRCLCQELTNNWCNTKSGREGRRKRERGMGVGEDMWNSSILMIVTCFQLTEAPFSFVEFQLTPSLQHSSEYYWRQFASLCWLSKHFCSSWSIADHRQQWYNVLLSNTNQTGCQHREHSPKQLKGRRFSRYSSIFAVCACVTWFTAVLLFWKYVNSRYGLGCHKSRMILPSWLKVF